MLGKTFLAWILAQRLEGHETCETTDESLRIEGRGHRGEVTLRGVWTKSWTYSAQEIVRTPTRPLFHVPCSIGKPYGAIVETTPSELP